MYVKYPTTKYHRWSYMKLQYWEYYQSGIGTYYLYQPGRQAAVLIIQTPEKINGKILKGYFQTLKN